MSTNLCIYAYDEDDLEVGNVNWTLPQINTENTKKIIISDNKIEALKDYLNRVFKHDPEYITNVIENVNNFINIYGKKYRIFWEAR